MNSDVNKCVLIVVAAALSACSPQESNTASSAQSSADTPEMAACRMGAQSMIDVARQAVNDPSSRPERRESRRVLLEDWVARLEAGEDPCSVYAAIGNASNTF
ncbi:MAG: hypothetical protein RL839_04835 [Gammaproteobacteria bacterium]